MKDAVFFSHIYISEEASLAFLREQGVLETENEAEPCSCGTRMRTVMRKRGELLVPSFRCPKRGCQRFRSVRTNNAFFTYGAGNSKLGLRDILQIVFYWCNQRKVTDLYDQHSPNTVTDWYTYCRETCSEIIKQRGKMVGTADRPVQIDESRFAGKRKYNKGRLLNGDLPPQERDATLVVQNQRNYGNRVDGPWVFGMCVGDDVRYFSVPDRKTITLLPIIQDNVEAGSHIHSDEWKAYQALGGAGFIHATVCHERAYVDDITGAHTQAIERTWLDSKTDIMKNKRGVAKNLLQGHLDEWCWRRANRGEDIFLAIIRDIRIVHRQ